MQREAYLEMAASEDRHWWFRGRRKILQSVIGRLKLPPPPRARILEIGAGTGGNLAMLARFGRVTAVEKDATARAIAGAKAAHCQDIRAGALPEEPVGADEVFDLICLFDVLEHVEEDEETLAVLRRHLAPGGYLLITVPAFRRLWSAHDVALHHKRRYEKAELSAKLRAAGYVIRKLSYINMALFPVAVGVRLLDRVTRSSAASGTKIPARPINTLFTLLFGAEAALLPVLNLPVGLSLLALAQGPEEG